MGVALRRILLFSVPDRVDTDDREKKQNNRARSQKNKGLVSISINKTRGENYRDEDSINAHVPMSDSYNDEVNLAEDDEYVYLDIVVHQNAYIYYVINHALSRLCIQVGLFRRPVLVCS